jgi:hypothetical protein
MLVIDMGSRTGDKASYRGGARGLSRALNQKRVVIGMHIPKRSGKCVCSETTRTRWTVDESREGHQLELNMREGRGVGEGGS